MLGIEFQLTDFFFLFFFQYLKDDVLLPSILIVSDERLAVILTFIPLYVISLKFSDYFLEVLFIFGFRHFDCDIPESSFLCVSSSEFLSSVGLQ